MGLTIKQAFLIFVGAIIVLNLFVKKAPTPPAISEEEKRQNVRKMLDQSTGTILSKKEHLERAKTILSRINVNSYEEAEVALQLVSEHGTEARTDPRLKAQADALMKRMAGKALEVVKIKVWASERASLVATAMCKMSIEARLKAPSTADWGERESGRWRNHPGYFLVTYSVDAQNSFGAKLRSSYQCQVGCLTEDICRVEKLYEVQR